MSSMEDQVSHLYVHINFINIHHILKKLKNHLSTEGPNCHWNFLLTSDEWMLKVNSNLPQKDILFSRIPTIACITEKKLSTSGKIEYVYLLIGQRRK